jgi:hypothetical protein
MKCLLIIIFIVAVTDSFSLKIKNDALMPTQSIINSMLTEMRQKQKNDILSKDYTIAKQALDKAIAERDEATLRLGLKKGSLSFKRDIVQAVKNAWYQSFVPDLMITLEDNQASTNTNAEDSSKRQELEKAIVSALMHLTGLRFSQSEELSTNDIQKIVEESRLWYQANEPEMKKALLEEMLERQQATPILSKNYRVAKSAFDKAVLEKDKATLRLGLKRESPSFKRDIVQAIKQFDDKSFVPDLIKALENNQLIMSGGLETQAEQQELNKEIISALAKLTDLKFDYLSDSSTIPCFSDCPSKDMGKVLEESKTWYQANEEEIQKSAIRDLSEKNAIGILSKDYKTAEKSLNKAIQENGKETIKLGLKSPLFPIRQKTVDEIIKMEDGVFVPNLVQALQENQGIIAGGTESDLMQKDFDRKIITALESLTKLDFEVKESLNVAKIEEIIKKSQDWLDMQKKE